MPSTRFVEDGLVRIMSLTPQSQNVYLLGTSLARPVIARGMIEVAEAEGCEYVPQNFFLLS